MLNINTDPAHALDYDVDNEMGCSWICSLDSTYACWYINS